MAEAMEEVRFPAGRVVFREGEAGDCFYLVRSGVAVVSRGQGPDRQVLARLREGAFFGERALLRAETRCMLGAASMGQVRSLHPIWIAVSTQKSTPGPACQDPDCALSLSKAAVILYIMADAHASRCMQGSRCDG